MYLIILEENKYDTYLLRDRVLSDMLLLAELELFHLLLNQELEQEISRTGNIKNRKYQETETDKYLDIFATFHRF